MTYQRIAGPNLAPMVKLRVFRPNAEEDLVETTDALIDSGADVSFLPKDIPAKIILPSVGSFVVGDINSNSRESPAFYPGVKIEGWNVVIPAAKFGEWNGPFAILGRNVLKHIAVLLDGPAGTLSIR